jgi:hypothetical protein
VRGDWGPEKADAVIYRLGLHALPVPGLPEELTVGNVEVSFVRGPVRAQQTVMRQRYGLPVIFDKQMSRREIAEGERPRRCVSGVARHRPSRRRNARRRAG